MDPNATLARIREMIENTSITSPCAELVELIDALDGWLTRGGFPPADWTPFPVRAE